MIQNQYDETFIIEQFNTENNQRLSLIENFQTIKNKISQTIKNLNAYFIPACLNHMILTRSDWNKLQIDQNYLTDELYCWALGKTNQDREKCNLKLIEKCSWPNCNRSCPNLIHPETNRIVDPINYLVYYGYINYQSLSAKSKINQNALKKMGYSKLMKVLSISN